MAFRDAIAGDASKSKSSRPILAVIACGSGEGAGARRGTRDPTWSREGPPRTTDPSPEAANASANDATPYSGASSASDRVGVDQFERGLEQELFKERITHLDRRTLGIRPGAELERREQRRASDPVAAGVATDQVHRAARSRAARLAEIFGACETDTHRVDQRVIGVARLERDVPGDVGDADAVSVKGDAAGHARDRAADGGIGRIAEEERVQHRGRARAHREDVAQDATDTGGSSLERL